MNRRKILAFVAGEGVLLLMMFAFDLSHVATLFGFGVVLLILSTTSDLKRSLADPRIPVVLAIAATHGWRAGLLASASALVASTLGARAFRLRDQGPLVVAGLSAGVASQYVSGLGLLVLLAGLGVTLEALRQGRQLIEQSRLLMLASAVSVGLLAVVLIESMGDWSIFIVGMVLFVMQHSMRLYSEVQEAYEATILATADAIEAGSAGKIGHSRRVADIAVRVARTLGLREQDARFLWRLALLHELNTGESGSLLQQDYRQAVSRSVACFADVLPVLSLMQAGKGLGDERLELLAYIVCRASNIDEAISGSTRSNEWYDEQHLISIAPSLLRERADEAFREALA